MDTTPEMREYLSRMLHELYDLAAPSDDDLDTPAAPQHPPRDAVARPPKPDLHALTSARGVKLARVMRSYLASQEAGAEKTGARRRTAPKTLAMRGAAPEKIQRFGQVMDGLTHRLFVMEGKAPAPSRMLLWKMKQITLAELTQNEAADGAALFLRPISSLTRSGPLALMAVEDTAGETELLLLLQQAPSDDDRDILAADSILAVKNPLLQTLASNAHKASAVVVHHPSHLVVLHAAHPAVPDVWRYTSTAQRSAQDWWGQAYDAICVNDTMKAIQCFTLGLEVADPQTDLWSYTILLNNRALMFLSTRRWEAALRDATACLYADRANLQAVAIAGDAESQLGRHASAAHLYEELLTRPSAHSLDAHALVRDALQRAVEEKTGIYDWEELVTGTPRATQSFTLNLQPQAASFLGRVYEGESTYTIPASRGLFAATDIRRGDLVLCEKAFSVAYHQRDDVPCRFIDRVNDAERSGAYTVLLAELVQKIMRNPELGGAVLDLYDGGPPRPKRRVVQRDNIPVVDASLISSIMLLNSFPCPTASSAASADAPERDGGYLSAGLWTTAARINHSCVGNSHRAFVGDLMVVRATRDIARGEEITFSYVDQTWRNVTRINETLERTWGFTCACALCDAERRSTKDAQRAREHIWASVVPAVLLSTTDGGNLAEDVVVKLRTAIADGATAYEQDLFRSLPRQPLARLQHLLAAHLMNHGDKKGSWEMSLAALHSMGFRFDPEAGSMFDVDTSSALFTPSCIDILLLLVGSTPAVGLTEFRTALSYFAGQAYAICFGEVISFRDQYATQWAFLQGEVNQPVADDH